MIITYEQIAQRAFEIWEREGRPEGRDQNHWLAAEAELRAETVKSQDRSQTTSRDPAMMKAPRRQRE